MPGYRLKLLNEHTGTRCDNNEKGVLVIEGPLPPGCLQTVFNNDERFIKSYWSNFSTEQVYSTFDWGIRDDDGYYFILGRTDDVINVAGHRLGTREIEESISSHPNVSEVAVVGVEDKLKGQVAVAFVIPKDASTTSTPQDKKQFEKEIFAVVDRQLGAVARPSRVYAVSLLPKTRSGKLLRRSIQALCEGRDPGDLTTIEDPNSLTQIKDALES
jgi:propionyl-CoA synthetase